MRILHYLQTVRLLAGGPPRAMIDLASAMHDRGHDVMVSTTDDRDVPSQWSADAGPSVLTLSCSPGPSRRLCGAALHALAAAVARSDVVHLHGVWESTNLQVAAACRRRGVPYVVSLHGMLDDWAMGRKSFRKRLHLLVAGRRYLRGAARIHCTAQGELEQAGRRVGGLSAEVVPNLVDLAPYSASPNGDEARRRWPALGCDLAKVLFLGRVHPTKGVTILIDAIATLRRWGRRIHLVIAGAGDSDYETRVRRQIEDLGMQSEVTWTGFVDGELKRSLYAACDLLALPTSQENFGLVLFEALAAGTPVVTTSVVDTREELVRSGGGVIVPHCVEGFVAAIQTLAACRRDAAAMGEAGREWVLRTLSVDRIATRFETLYTAAVGAGRAAPGRAEVG